MRVRCIDNKGYEHLIISGKTYTVVSATKRTYFVMCEDKLRFGFYKNRFEILPEWDFKNPTGRGLKAFLTSS